MFTANKWCCRMDEDDPISVFFNRFKKVSNLYLSVVILAYGYNSIETALRDSDEQVAEKVRKYLVDNYFEPECRVACGLAEHRDEDHEAAKLRQLRETALRRWKPAGHSH